jgi:STE24 endopeptidase
MAGPLTSREEKAARYSRLRYALSITETVWFFLLLVLFSRLGFSAALARVTRAAFPGWLVFPVFLFSAFAAYCVLSFPLTFYHSFLLEHRFGLSRQSLKAWAFDHLKAGCLAYLFCLVLLACFYAVLKSFPQGWWLVISLLWVAFNIFLAAIAPVAIVPLFFKYKAVSDQALRSRIIGLAKKMGVTVRDVFEIDLSSKTLKANAALLGWGATRRVVLGDTLKERYTPDEIEVILAHEFAHQKLHHLVKMLLINSAASVGCFYLIYATYPQTLEFLGLASLADISSLPLVMVYFLLFGVVTQPLSNLFSRVFEKHADRLALEATGNSGAFISTMEKLADQNLSDRDPHPLIKFFFFDHPPIKERIALARGTG